MDTFVLQLIIIVIMVLLRRVAYEVIELVVVIIDQFNELLKRRIVYWFNKPSAIN